MADDEQNAAAAAENAVEPPNAATAALTNVLSELLTWLNNAGVRASTNNANTTVVYDLYDDTNPFNLATRTGLTAYEKSCKPLPIIWDGTVEKFPPFILALMNRFDKFGWNATGDSGIASIGTKALLKEYHSIQDDDAKDAFNAITNERAKQNLRALYETLEASISGNVKIALFDTSSTKPRKNDGWDLFLKLTQLTTLASIQTSISATNKLTTYCPSTDNFNIAATNKTINHLLILATTSQRKFEDLEKIQILLSAYDRIRQPVEWSTWVHQKKTDYNDGKITSANKFQTEALVKQNQIIDQAPDRKFKGSLQSMQEEIVSMVAKQVNELKSKPKSTTTGKRKRTDKSDEQGKPNFLKWTSTKLNGGTAFKVGDTKMFGETKYHFCDCPWHKDGVRWHVHSAPDCRTRKRWMDKEGRTDDNDATANNADADADADETADDQKPDADAEVHDLSRITGMLGDVMKSLEDGGAATSVPQALLTDAITAISDLS